MSITQWTREREQKIAAANRKAWEDYLDKRYKDGWKPPAENENSGPFDFFEMGAIIGVVALLAMLVQWAFACTSHLLF